MCNLFLILAVLAVGGQTVITGPLPKPWDQHNLEEYEAGVTSDAYAGLASVYLKSRPEINPSRGAIMQMISIPENWKGRRLRLSAFFKTIDVEIAAVLDVGIATGSGEEVHERTPSRLLQSNSDWTRIQVDLDVPYDGIVLRFGPLLTGKGEVRADSFELDVGENQVGPAGNLGRLEGSFLSNLDFEDLINALDEEPSKNPLPNSWGQSNHVEYEAGVTTDSFEGRASAYLKSKDLGTLSRSKVGQTVIVPDQWRDSRLKLTAYLKTIGIEGFAGLHIQIHTSSGEEFYDYINKKPIRSDADWTQYRIVLDVPDDAVIFSAGFYLRGKGEVRADYFEIEKVSDDVNATWKRHKTKHDIEPRNMDFEDLPDSFVEALEENPDL